MSQSVTGATGATGISNGPINALPATPPATPEDPMPNASNPMTAADVKAALVLLDTSGRAVRQMAEGFPSYMHNPKTVRDRLADFVRHGKRIEAVVAKLTTDREQKMAARSTPVVDNSLAEKVLADIGPGAVGATGPVGVTGTATTE